MEVVQYLKKNGIEKLKEEFGIKVKEYPDVYILNYDQIESPKMHSITRECRSLVLDKDFDVVSRSFDRFFNLGEGGECEVDFENAVALEKVDGSLIGLAKYPDGRWYFRTRGTAYAEAQMPNGKVYQEEILKCIGVADMDELQKRMRDVLDDTTLIFEYVSPDNRIVTRYTEPQLVLLAVRTTCGKYPAYCNGPALEDTANILSEEFSQIRFKNVRACKMFSIKTQQDVESLVSNLEDLQEGFVVLDLKKNTRVKVKHAAYLKAHKIRGNNATPSVADIAELVVENEQEEFLAYFEEYRPMFDAVSSVWEKLTTEAEVLYNTHKDIENQKDFAMQVKSDRLSGIIFTARAKKQEFKHALAEAKSSMKVKVLVEAVK